MKNDIVTQYGSFAHGAYTTASGQASHAEGVGTIANHLAQNVSGMYNIPDPASTTDDQRGIYIEIVGNGTASTLSNARTLDWEGNEKISGNLTINAGTTSEVTITPELLNNAGGSNSGEGSALKYVKDVQGYEKEQLTSFNLDITENDFEDGQLVQRQYQVTNLTESDFNTLFNTLLSNNAGDDRFLAYLTFGNIGTYGVIYCQEYDSNKYISISSGPKTYLSLWIEEGKVLVSDFQQVPGYVDSIKQILEQNSELNEATIINIYKLCKTSNEEDPFYSVVVNNLENIASGYFSYAEGKYTAASGYTSHAEGGGTTASGSISHAEGSGTTASGDGSHAEGGGTTASAYYAHAEGSGTTASGQNSHAEGGGTTASGTNSHAEGEDTKAFGNNSHAEGANTTAGGTNSHAEGGGTTASGTNSHAEGGGTTASGGYSHAEGEDTTASGYASHVEGYYTIANHKSQHVFGQYNIEDSSSNSINARGDYVEIVGNGSTITARSNARTLDWEGNEQIAGNLTLGMGTTAQVTITPQQLTALLAMIQ